MPRSAPLAPRAVAALLAAALASCGDPLTDGAWRGTPSLIVRGAVAPIDPAEDGAQRTLAVVWSPLGEAATRFPVVAGAVDDGPEVGAFELALYAAPPAPAAGVDDLPLAVGLLALVEHAPDRWDTTRDAAALAADVVAVSGDHYLVWVADADAVRDRAAAHILNPIALEDGYNLALGVCRPGRPSQLSIVQPERVTLAPVAEPDVGDCLDVYWGPWRAP